MSTDFTSLEEAVKKVLGTKVFKSTGEGGEGCISKGYTYITDTGSVFVKVNHGDQAYDMFVGESAGLDAILETKTIRAPKPRSLVRFGGKTSAALVLENLNMRHLNTKGQTILAERLANMHLHNINLWKEQEGDESRVTPRSSGAGKKAITQFGFQVPTACGYILQRNEWDDSWANFFIRQKLAFQVDEVLKKGPDPQLSEVWELCLEKISKVLSQVKPIPALVHGDLWSGNVSAVGEEPVIYDPAAFYGHHEYEFGIINMFGGFSRTFHRAYHEKIPEEPGFELRVKIYELFHHLNHWNHFGHQYKGSALKLMKSIVKD